MFIRMTKLLTEHFPLPDVCKLDKEGCKEALSCRFTDSRTKGRRGRVPCLTQARRRDKAGCLGQAPVPPSPGALACPSGAQAGAGGMVHWGCGAEAQLVQASADRSLFLPLFTMCSGEGEGGEGGVREKGRSRMCQRQRLQASAFPLTLHLPLLHPQFPAFIGYWGQADSTWSPGLLPLSCWSLP